MMPTLLLSVLAAWSSTSPALGDEAGGGGELKRGAFFGAKVAAVSDETRERLKLDAGLGVTVEAVIPGSTAADNGLQAGDVVVAFNGVKVAGPGEFVATIGGLKEGASVTIEVRRGDVVQKKDIKLKGRPFEASDAYEVIYGSVPSRAGRVRTIVTRPKEPGKRPALFLIQGIGLFSMDNPTGSLASYKAFIDDFTRHGFVTLRVDKPGCGDSEGGPARDVDFDTELDGYRQALKMLKAREDVDSENIFVFGHSMGGVMAPLLSSDVPVRGIIVYGTIARTWTEYMLENTRRQMELADAAPAAIDSTLKTDAALLTHLYAEKMPPQEIALKFPALRKRIEETITDDRYFVDRSLTFFGQLADKNLGAAWESFDGHALAIWAKGDFVSNEDDHALIARIVNRSHPGRATFLALDGIDHGFNRAASRRESFDRSQSRQPGEFNPAILEVCRAWIEKTSARPAGKDG